MTRPAVITLILFLTTSAAQAQVPDLGNLLPEGDALLSGRMIQLIALLGAE